jgi:DNA replication and repair protein RecF
MLSRIQLRDFRCFPSLGVEFIPGRNIFIGENAQGKTSLLEAICVLLRLQSPRTSGLSTAIRQEKRGFVLDGYSDRRHLQFYYSRQRRKLALDSVEQKSSAEYLQVGRVVWFSNQDTEIVRGPADQRRAFLDFLAAQVDPGYLRHLRTYREALRSRNQLLKMSRPSLREIEAFNQPLERSGTYLAGARVRLIAALQPAAQIAHGAVSEQREAITLSYESSTTESLKHSLQNSLREDLRLRQTTVGPHRDDLRITLNALGSDLASEGQQRTVALALKLAQAKLIEQDTGLSPILLIDDIFGELDPRRRNALIRHLPPGGQCFITTTHLDWLTENREPQKILRLFEGRAEEVRAL